MNLQNIPKVLFFILFGILPVTSPRSPVQNLSPVSHIANNIFGGVKQPVNRVQNEKREEINTERSRDFYKLIEKFKNNGMSDDVEARNLLQYFNGGVQNQGEIKKGRSVSERKEKVNGQTIVYRVVKEDGKIVESTKKTYDENGVLIKKENHLENGPKNNERLPLVNDKRAEVQRANVPKENEEKKFQMPNQEVKMKMDDRISDVPTKIYFYKNGKKVYLKENNKKENFSPAKVEPKKEEVPKNPYAEKFLKVFEKYDNEIVKIKQEQLEKEKIANQKPDKIPSVDKKVEKDQVNAPIQKAVQENNGLDKNKLVQPAEKPKENIPKINQNPQVDLKKKNLVEFLADSNKKHGNQKLLEASPKKDLIKNNIPIVKKPLINVENNAKQFPIKPNTQNVNIVPQSEINKNNEQTSNNSGFVPIKVKWELGAVKDFLEKRRMTKQYNFLQYLIQRATTILEMYIWLPISEPTIIELPKGSVCPEYNVPNPIRYDAHLVMVARVFDDSSEKEQAVIAKSSFCKLNQKGRSIIGRIAFNLANMVDENSSFTEKEDYLYTVVHEVLHTIAFNSKFTDLFANDKIKKNLVELEKIRRIKPRVYNSGHWIEESFTTSIMTPTSKHGSIVTEVDLEVFEQQNDAYQGQRTKLPYDTFYDEVKSMSDFLEYKCKPSDEQAKYKFFCSHKQAQRSYTSCSIDYTRLIGCDLSVLSNDCTAAVPLTGHNCLDASAIEKSKDGKYEHRGSDSRCFEASNTGRSVCLKYKTEGNVVKVFLGPNVYECKKSNELISAEYPTSKSTYISVQFYCPDINKFINYEQKTSCPDDCHHNGFCSNGNCICYGGTNERDNCKTKKSTVPDIPLFSESKGITISVTDKGK